MINLLPPQTRTNLRIARSNTVLLRYVELLTIVLLITITAYVAGQYFLSTQQRNVQSVVDVNAKTASKLEESQKEAEQLSSAINIISGLLSREISFSQMLEQTSALLPQGSVLTGLQFSIEDLKSPLVITAQVDSEAKAAILLKNLQASDLFEDTQLVNISQIKSEESTSVLSTPIGESQNPVVSTSPYKFTAVINAFLKPVEKGNQP